MTGGRGPGETGAGLVGDAGARPGRPASGAAAPVASGNPGAGRAPTAVVVDEWVGVPDERLRAEIHRVVAGVVDLGGAVGFLATPDRAEVDAWIDSLLDGIARGRTGMVLCRVDGRVEALGSWARGAPGPQGHTALLSRIMAHPSARGLGLGRRVVTSLVDAVAAVGVEVALLSVRGNNHGAVALYEDCGFTVYGVVPNGLAVGDVRFDEVRMVRQVALPETVTVHGRAVGGPGGSVRRRARDLA